MNPKEYIKSGVLHGYCLNLLSESKKDEVIKMCAQYPVIKKEFLRLQKALDKFDQKSAEPPAVSLKESIWNTLENITREKSGNINNQPVINKYSDAKHWKRIVLPFMPKDNEEDMFMTPLRQSDGVLQMLVIGRVDVPNEQHHDERESFLVLEGECECTIGDNVIRLGPGGFVEIPMYTDHDVKTWVTNGYFIQR